MSLAADQTKQVELLLEGINKSLKTKDNKEEVVRILGHDHVIQVPRLSSGSVGINRALGGGYARGRVIEIYGPESSGKTTLTLHAIAEAQSQGEVCAFIDAEHALDVTYAEKLGVDADSLIIAQPDNAEQALEIVDLLVSSGIVSVIVVDSVAALVPRAELEGNMGDSHMGLQARLMSQALRKLTGKCQRNNVTLFFINQLRSKIGVFFGSPETTTGGNALKFYASQRVDVRRTGQIKDSDETVANETKIKIVKNKVAAPYKIAQVIIRFGEGVDKYTDLVRCAIDANIIQKKGAWYSMNGTNISQGEANAAQYLKDNADVAAEVLELLEKPKEVK